MTDARFDVCLPLILKEEGGNNDDPNDHGGRTSRGITQREYDPWRQKHGLPTRDVWTASDDEVRKIYYENYWLPRCPELHPGVDLVYFNIAVNAGPGEAAKLLDRSIGGPDEKTIEKFSDSELAFYRGLAQFSRYGKGWTARDKRIEAAALDMVITAVPPPPVPLNYPAIFKQEGHIMVDVSTLAGQAEKVVETVARIEPTIATIASMFVPGASPVVATVQPMVLAAIPYVERALNDIAAGNGGDFMGALIEVLQHLSKGQPNSPTLSS